MDGFKKALGMSDSVLVLPIFHAKGPITQPRHMKYIAKDSFVLTKLTVSE